MSSRDAENDGNVGGAAAKPGPPQREATMKDFVRVFSYAKRLDCMLIVAAMVSSIGSGVVSSLSVVQRSRETTC